MLVTAGSAQQVLSVLPIVGMGGLGKTTLARKVFSDQKIVSRFEGKRVWVHVPQNFDATVLLKNILTSMTTENVEHGNKEALLKILQENLGNKNYLLVLDDVWNEEIREKWDDFVNSLSGVSSSVGNCVVVTTRNHEVASIVSTLGVHRLGGLSADDCWSIIKAKTCNAADQYEEVGRNIAQRCQGLPLAAKVVGGLLCNKSRDEWNSLEKNWISNFGDLNPIHKILKLSFDNLSSPSLKKCFAYCSIFAKGTNIQKEKLIELWMGEGFLLQTDSSNNMESTGSAFLDILLQQSLLQVTRRHDKHGYVTHCNMHDLVHDVARSILVGENNNAADVRYIGYNSGGEIESLSNYTEEKAKHVRTLFFDGNVSDITFSNFKSLHTLTLVGREIVALPDSISALIHLRYLDTSKTRIACFPESLGELHHLETLRAKRFNKKKKFFLEKLPDSLTYLFRLRHLHIPKTTTLPPHIGRLTSLQMLSHFHVEEVKGCGISELGSLNNLKGKLVIHNLEKVKDKDEAMLAELFQKADVLDLRFIWRRIGANRKGDEVSVLEGLEPHPNLKRLTIRGFNGQKFPSWTLKMEVRGDGGLNNLSKINLENCKNVKEVPTLGHLPLLKTLTLSKLENVTCIGSSFYGIKADTKFVFPVLERLELSNMPSLREWAGVEFSPSESDDEHETDQPYYQVVLFPRLEHLSVSKCKKLKSAPRNFKCLTDLDMDEMDSDLPLQNICGGELSTLQRVKIKKIRLERFPDGIFSNNHNLSVLKVVNCSKLRELPDGLRTLTKLKRLVIKKCPLLLKGKSKEEEVTRIVDSEWAKISHFPLVVVDGRPII